MGVGRRPEFITSLEYVFFRSSGLRNHRPSPQSLPIQWAHHFLPLRLSPIQFYGRHFGPCVKMAPPRPRGKAQAGQEAARTRARAREGGVMTPRRLSAPGSRPAPGPTPLSATRANPEVEEEARRRWLSGRALSEPYCGGCLGLGAGGGAERPGQPGLDGAGEVMASAELQGKYQKLAQEYSKVPIVGGDRGSPALRPRVA